MKLSCSLFQFSGSNPIPDSPNLTKICGILTLGMARFILLCILYESVLMVLVSEKTNKL